MSMVVTLRERLPVYNMGELENTENFIIGVDIFETAETDNSKSEWVNDALKRGEVGEKAVKIYLENKYNAIVKKQLDFIGYDYLVKVGDMETFVEVKTSSNNRLFISINEIEKAKEYGEKYHLYFVITEEQDTNIICTKLFVMKNPYEKLSLDWILNLDRQKLNFSIKIQSVQLSFDNYNDFTQEEDFKGILDRYDQKER